MPKRPAPDHDNAWKELLDRHFPEFMAFFFPAISAAVNWARKPVFLDKELPKLGPTHAVGTRLADKLAQVWLKDGTEVWVLLHSEIQGRVEADFNRRMYTYNYRITDRYKTEVISLGVVTGGVGRTKLGRYETGRWGCRLTFEFPVVKMTDWRGREQELEQSSNPFALVVQAQLAVLKTRGDTARKFAAKRELILRLLDAGYERKYVDSLLRFLDWIIRLPEELEEQLHETVEQTRGETKVPYITSWERRGMRRGEEIGERKLVLRQLKRKLGELSEEVTAQIDQLPGTRLEKLADALLDFTTPEDLTRWLKRKAS